MKLHLPRKFQAALMAALASVSFTTLGTGAVAVATGTALLSGQKAVASTVAELNEALEEVLRDKEYVAGDDYEFSFTLTTVDKSGTGPILTLANDYFFITQEGKYGGLSNNSSSLAIWLSQPSRPSSGQNVNVWEIVGERALGWISYDADGTGKNPSPLDGSTITVKYSASTNTTTFELYHKNKNTTDRVIMSGVALEADDFIFGSKIDNGTDLVFRASRNLVWNVDADTWDVGNTQSWHRAADIGEAPVVFNQNDNVTFEETGDFVSATLDADITAGSITLESGSMVTLAPRVGESHSLTVKDLVLNAGSSLATAAPVNVTGTVNIVSSSEDGEPTGLVIYSGEDSTISADIISSKDAELVNAAIYKYGDSTLTLTGDNSQYYGQLNVAEGTLKATGEDSLGHAYIDVSAGATLSLAGESVINADTIVLENGSIIAFENGALLNLGELILVADEAPGASCVVTWNLEGYNNFTGSGPATLIQNVDILGAEEDFSWDPESVNTPDNITVIALEYNKNARTVVLTYSMDGGRDLIWDGENGTSWTAASNWHVAGKGDGTSVFGNGDNVQFTTAPPNATTVLGADVSAGTMKIDSGAAVTLDTDVYNLTAKELVTNGGSLTKTGTGKATFGETGTEGVVTLNTLQVDEGTVEFNQHVIVDRNRINVAYAAKDAKTGVSAVFNKGLDFTGTDSKNYAMVVGYGNTVVLGGVSNLGSNKIVGIARNGTLELQADATASVGSVHNSSTPDNNGTLKLGKGAIFNITNASGSSTLTNIVNGGTLNVSGGLTVHSAVSGAGKIVYNGPAGKTMQLNGGGTMGKITVNSGNFVTTGAQNITLGGLTVDGGTAHVGNSGYVDLGVVDLKNGSLVLNNTASAESLTTSTGTTLTFAGIGDKILTTTGDINLDSGTIIDLSNIHYRTDVGEQSITLATSSGVIYLAEEEDAYAFTHPKTTGATFSLDTQGNNLVLVVNQTISPFHGGNVRYTYTDTEGTHAIYENEHNYNFSAADGGVVEFNPERFNNETHTYTDNTARTMPLHANTTFVVEEGNTVILGAQVIGNNGDDDQTRPDGISGSFTKDGGGTLVMALNSGVFSKVEQGKKFDYNHYEGDVIVKEGTLHILPHSKMNEDAAKTSMLAGREDASVTVNKDATLILDPTTGILMPYGNENSGEVNNSFTLRTAAAGGPVATLTNLLLDKSGLRPVDARDGARANVTDAWTFTIADSRTLQDAMTITAADITVIGEMGLEGNFTIDNTHIKATGDCDINEAAVYQGKNPTAVLRNGSIIEFSGEETWTMARIWNSDVDKTSKINFFGKNVEAYIVGYLTGNNKIEVASTENGGVAERKIETGEDLITTIDYTTDQYKGMMLYDASEEGKKYPLSFAVTLSDTDLPEDLSNSEFYLTFTDFDSSALLDDEFVDVRGLMDVSLVIPQYTGGEWEELVAAVYARYDTVTGDTVFMFQHVTPEPTTSTLSLLALAALAARRRRRK